MWTAVGILFSKSGVAVEKIWRGNPIIRAVVIIAVALVLLDLAARESLSLWETSQTVQAKIDKANADAISAKVEAVMKTTDSLAGSDANKRRMDNLQRQMDADKQQAVTPEEQKKQAEIQKFLDEHRPK